MQRYIFPVQINPLTKGDIKIVWAFAHTSAMSGSQNGTNLSGSYRSLGYYLLLNGTLFICKWWKKFKTNTVS